MSLDKRVGKLEAAEGGDKVWPILMVEGTAAELPAKLAAAVAAAGWDEAERGPYAQGQRGINVIEIVRPEEEPQDGR